MNLTELNGIATAMVAVVSMLRGGVPVRTAIAAARHTREIRMNPPPEAQYD